MWAANGDTPDFNKLIDLGTVFVKLRKRVSGAIIEEHLAGEDGIVDEGPTLSKFN